MSELLKVNVNDHTEKKGGLTYLSWAWAWAEVLKVDPAATWVVNSYGPQGAEQPCMWIGETAIVHTSVTINGLRRECMLPVMDNRNNAVKSPDARKISDAIMRCMTKAIAMHGLGLYIYAGEDLPEGDETAQPEAHVDNRASAPALIFDSLQPEEQDLCRKIAAAIVKAMPDMTKVLFTIEMAGLENEMKAGVWSLLDSKTRSSIKSAQSARDRMPATVAGQ